MTPLTPESQHEYMNTDRPLIQPGIQDESSYLENSNLRKSSISKFRRGSHKRSTLLTNPSRKSRNSYLKNTLIHSINRIQERYRMGHRSKLHRKTNLSKVSLSRPSKVSKVSEVESQKSPTNNFVKNILLATKMKGVMSMFQKKAKEARERIDSRRNSNMSTPKLGDLNNSRKKKTKVSGFGNPSMNVEERAARDEEYAKNGSENNSKKENANGPDSDYGSNFSDDLARIEHQ